ncbi:MAG: hypothetical protein SGILL_007093 [Bacillariaceae sp.]
MMSYNRSIDGGAVFDIPNPAKPGRKFAEEYNKMLLAGDVNAVNHGEFESTVSELMDQAEIVDIEKKRTKATIAIQRCRRGGKTFMLHAVAAMLEQRLLQQQPGTTHVIFISLSSITPLMPHSEDAYNAIVSRIAWELSGREHKTFTQFKRRYQDFGQVDGWLTAEDNKVILIVDELNIIPYSMKNYGEMCALLDNFVQQKGCALLYSTHQRSTADWLRGRRPGTGLDLALSKRTHLWKNIPRIVTEDCLRGLQKNPAGESSFWSAVLRGRIPALVLQDEHDIRGYTRDMFFAEDSQEERIKCLKAVISGEINSLTNARNLFRAYSYMSERFADGETSLFAWPPFMVAQSNVLGKNYPLLYTTLANPSIDEPKAFEALTQLAVLVRLISQMEHDLVPVNTAALEQQPDVNCFMATELFHVGQNATTIAGVIESVQMQFSRRQQVHQVVAVPLFASFPVYDFFLLHRTDNGWEVAAGYQCKQGTMHPKEDADPTIPLSVWLEGKCRKYRVESDGSRVESKLDRGWVMLGESNQCGLLGVSVSEALPQDPSGDAANPLCDAEMDCKHLKETSAVEGKAGGGTVQPASKKTRKK